MELFEVSTEAVLSVDNMNQKRLNGLSTHIDILHILFFLSKINFTKN